MVIKREEKTPRQYALEAQERLFPAPTSLRPTLPEIVLLIRKSINGSADPWPDDQLEEVREMLRARLETWDVRSNKIDSCIYVMCQEAIDAISRELAERRNTQTPKTLSVTCPDCGETEMTVYTRKGDKPTSGVCAKCKQRIFIVYV